MKTWISRQQDAARPLSCGEQTVIIAEMGNPHFQRRHCWAGGGDGLELGVADLLAAVVKSAAAALSPVMTWR
jgi:hypothetical protein